MHKIKLRGLLKGQRWVSRSGWHIPNFLQTFRWCWDSWSLDHYHFTIMQGKVHTSRYFCLFLSFGFTTLGVGDGQGGLACCDSWGRKESDTTERLNWTELNWMYLKHLEQCLAHSKHSINTFWMKNMGKNHMKGYTIWTEVSESSLWWKAILAEGLSCSKCYYFLCISSITYSQF